MTTPEDSTEVTTAPPVEPAVEPLAAPEPEPTPVTPLRVTPAPTAGERVPQMIERTRRRGRRRRAPVFTPQEVKSIDYKDVDKLKKLISDRGRIEPRRKTGLTAKDQRKLAREIKRARHVALLPYTAEHMRQTSRYRMVSRMAQRALRRDYEQEVPPPAADGAVAPEPTAPETATPEPTAVETVAAEAAAAPAPVPAAPESAE